MRTLTGLILTLLLCMPSLAGTKEFCSEPTKDHLASSELRADPATAGVLDRHTTERGLNSRGAAAELRGLSGDDLDSVVGHLRLTAREAVGDRRVEVLWVLFEMKVGGRADVADQFIECMGWDDPRARSVCATGLGFAPDSKMVEAGNALFDSLKTETDKAALKSGLVSLVRIASPELRSRREQLRSLLRQEQPGEMDPRSFTSWKRDEGQIAIRILGPEDAIALFRELDATQPGQRSGIEGAAGALAEYGQYTLPEMAAAESDGLRDLIRGYAVQLLSQDSRELAKRDHGIRLQAAHLLWAVVSSRLEGIRDVDLAAMRDACTYALGFEDKDSRVASTLMSLLEWVPPPAAAQRDAATQPDGAAAAKQVNGAR